MKHKGMTTLFTCISASHSFKVGEGFVGQVFKAQQPTFVEDLHLLTDPAVCAKFFNEKVEFKRADKAMQFDIQSVIFVPLKNSVIELGSVRKLQNASDMLGDKTLAAIKSGGAIAPFSDAFVRPKTCENPKLRKLVEAANGASFAIEWALGADGSLKVVDYYNPWWRVEEVRAKGKRSMYTTGSREYTVKPGQGILGKVFNDEKPKFCEDVQAEGAFLRLELAKEYNIRTALFVPVKHGVFELGSNRTIAKELFISDSAVSAALMDEPAATVEVHEVATGSFRCC